MVDRPGAVADLVTPRPLFGGCYRGRRVLVTGHTGFKGSWLTLWLQHLGASVNGLATAPPTTPSLFAECGLADRMHSVEADVRDLTAVLMAFEEHRPEIVFHLAAQPLVLDSYRHPAETFETNVMGTVNVLEAARRVPGVRAAVIVTTDKCYEAGAAGGPHREGDPLGGHDPYSASKAAAELVARAYRDSFCDAPWARAIATVRAGNIIGGGDWSADRIVPDAVRALRSGRPLVVRHPEAVRPWQHVLDALAGYLTVGARLLDDPAGAAGAWNFGPDQAAAVTVGAVVDALAAAWSSVDNGAEDAGGVTPLAVTVAGAPPALFEQPVLRLDTKKAREELGWAPVLPFADAIALTAAWYRRHAAGMPAAALTEHQIVAFEQRAATNGAPWTTREERACATVPS